MTQPLRIYSGHDSGRFQNPILSSQPNRQQGRRNAALLATASLVATFALFPFDATLASLLSSVSLGVLPTALLEATTPFATVGGVGLVAIAIAASSPTQSKSCAVLVICACLAGMTATCFRTVILRTAPAVIEQPASLGESPRLNVQASFSADGHCFPAPAGAIAISAGLAFGQMFQRGRIVFMTIALFTLARHAFIGQHYVSDLTAGSTIGCFSYLLWYESRFATTRVSPWVNAGDSRSITIPVGTRRAA